MKYVFGVLFLLISNFCLSQNLQITDSLRQFPLKYSIYFNLLALEPGLQYNIGNGFVGRIALTPGLSLIETPFANTRFSYEWIVNPGIFYELAYYPWVKKRNLNNRNMDNFSGLFIAACGKTTFYNPPPNASPFDYVTPILALTPGLRYSFVKYGYMHLQLGPSVSHIADRLSLSAYGEAGLGFFLSVADKK